MKSKKSKFENIWLRSICVAVFCAVLSFILYENNVFLYLENKAYDKKIVRTSSSLKTSDEIVLIAIDQNSLDWALEEKGWSWPWPREAYANIVEFLSNGNVNSIMFDMFYTEPSVYGTEDDIKFSNAQKGSSVVHTVFEKGDEEYLLPIDLLKDTASLIANVTSCMDSDDVIRRYSPFYEIDNKKVPSLGAAPLVLEGEELTFPSMLKDGTVRLRYHKSIDDYLPYSACDILESYEQWKNGEESYYLPEDFEGTYVFFALYAPGLFDICSTPIAQVYPGVGVHMTFLDNYLQDNFIHDVPSCIIFLWFLFVSFLGSFIITIGERQKTQLKVMLFMNIGVVLGALFVYEFPCLLLLKNYNLPQVFPFICYLVSVALMFGFVYIMEGKQKRFIKSAFSQCLSKDVVNDIINNPSSFTLGGKKMQMSAMFTDIQKFSSFSELLTASQLGILLNYYLTKMSDIIINERGTVDKYEGDAIVAMFGAPVQMNNHAIVACRAALKMKKEEALMNKEILEVVEKENRDNIVEEELYEAFCILVKNHKTLFTRIGINSGEMIAGYFGSKLKKNYTIMGNNVNLASRLEGINKQYSTYGIMISESTNSELGQEFVTRSLDKVQVVNVNTPIQLYELLEEKEKASNDLLSYVDEWESAIKEFKEDNYSVALEKFKALRNKELSKNDKVLDYYIMLIEKFFIKGKYPVEADDIGVSYNKELKVFKLLQK